MKKENKSSACKFLAGACGLRLELPKEKGRGEKLCPKGRTGNLSGLHAYAEESISQAEESMAHAEESILQAEESFPHAEESILQAEEPFPHAEEAAYTRRRAYTYQSPGEKSKGIIKIFFLCLPCVLWVQTKSKARVMI
jgi:hypothetical protein